MNFRRAAQDDLPSILGLLEANLVDKLSAEERRSGFLSAKFTPTQLAEMANDLGIIVADDGGRITGFLCASQLEFNRQFPLLAAMLQHFDRLQYGGKPLSASRAFMYGPVCVERSQRGKGVLRGLYEKLLTEVAGKFEVGVAFVARDNPHSLRAHVDGLGMADIGEFEFSRRAYAVVAFAVPRPVAMADAFSAVGSS